MLYSCGILPIIEIDCKTSEVAEVKVTCKEENVIMCSTILYEDGQENTFLGMFFHQF